MTSRRYDRAELRLDAAEKLPNGWLRVPAVVGKAECVLEYTRADGSTFREYRPAEHVFDAKSLASGELAPVTNDHPPVNLDGTNTRRYQRGSSGPARRDGNLVIRDLLITDAELVEDMLSGKVEVSPGYQVESVPTPGVTPGGERYDAIQTQIVINHHAIVDCGRQGPDVSVRMDSGDAFATTLRPTMKTKITIDGKHFEVPSEVAAELQRLDAAKSKAKADEDEDSDEKEDEDEDEDEENKDKRKRGDSHSRARSGKRGDSSASALRAERDALKSRLDKLESGFQARLDARVELLATAKRVCGTSYRSDGKDDLSVMHDVILRLDPDAASALKANEGDAGYIRARFDVALRAEESKANYGQQILEVARTATRVDAEPTPIEKSRAARDQRYASSALSPAK
jgi:uncharacterized protein